MYSIPETQLYIGGKLRPAAAGRTYDNINPWTREPAGKTAAASPEDVNEAIAAARLAFDTTDWSTNHDKRLKFVAELYGVFMANKDRLVQIARDEVGASLAFATYAQVGLALAGWKDLVDAYPRVNWKEDRGKRGTPGALTQRYVMREAAGVVAAITPFNVPLFVNIEKVISAFLAGCTVILKPSPDTPALGAIWGEFAAQIDLPPGVLNVITGPEPALGEILVTDPRVDLISFTGSSAVGKLIMEKGAATLKRVLLELGGKSAKIILDDAPNFAQEVASSMLVAHSGQGCAAQSRLLVPKSRYAEAVGALKAAYAAYDGKWGNYDDPANMMGPVVSRKQMDRIKNYIDIGIAEGATLLAGGKARDDMGGFFIEPTCFVDVKNEMRIAREEIFGPVVVVIPYSDEADAVRIANDNEYGLSGSIVTADLERGLQVANRIRTGSMSINGGRCIDCDIPFGGYKQSGLGHAWGVEGIEEYTETKIVAYRVAG